MNHMKQSKKEAAEEFLQLASAGRVDEVIHIFRFEGDKIIESWEASQEALKDSPNDNGLF